MALQTSEEVAIPRKTKLAQEVPDHCLLLLLLPITHDSDNTGDHSLPFLLVLSFFFLSLSPLRLSLPLSLSTTCPLAMVYGVANEEALWPG